MTPTSTALLLIGTKKGLFVARSDDDRRTWTMDGPHLAMQAVASCAIDRRGGATRLLAGGLNEHWGPTVLRSDDLGVTWDQRAESDIKFPEGTDASVEQIWALVPDTDDRPGVVWAGTQPSALWRSTDGGERFELVRGLWDHPHRPSWQPGYGGQAVHTVLPDPRDRDRMVVAMSTGGVYRTGDGGASWSPANAGIHAWFFPDPLPEFGQCVHKVARDAADPDTLYAQNHGGVYRTTDGGTTWSPREDGLPAVFGFPVVAHPRDPGRAWVVPLRADSDRLPPENTLQVWATDDGGASWQRTGPGLPSGYYAVVLRDAFSADDADPVGLYLGGRDGTVWASRDTGDSWQQVATHLPDVLCVRAAVLP